MRLVAGVTAAFAITSCSPGQQTSSSAPTQLRILAAASLATVMPKLATAYDADHPGTSFQFAFAGSSTLASQIVNGAPADVFASADSQNMTRVTTAGLADGAPTTFATNTLEIVAAKGNPKKIHGLPDLARPGLVVVLCAPDVPCGGYAQQSLRAAGVTVHPASLETDVSSVLRKVQLGEADAGIVYTTDVRGANSVSGVPIPDRLNIMAIYPVAALKSAHDRAAARSFVSFLGSPVARQVLRDAGFHTP